MAISADYITLQRAIADELGNRTDLLSPLSDSNLSLSPIQNAIQSAVSKWEREPFYFLETYDHDTPLFTTVAGREFYTAADDPDIATSPYITTLHVLLSAIRCPITKRSWQYIEDQSTNPAARGQPYDWAYFAQQIRLYPIPDGAYPIRATRTARITELSADGDTNVWTTAAYDLIRSEAKLILARDTLHDPQLASECEVAIYGNPMNPQDRGFLSVLKAETARRGRSRVRPTQF